MEKNNLVKEKEVSSVYSILEKEGLFLEDNSQLNQLEYNTRYCRLVPQLGNREKRFLKVLMSDRSEDKHSFRREIVVTDYLNKETSIPAQRVYGHSFEDDLRPYAVFEALPEKHQIYFIEKPGVVKLIREDAKKCIEHLLKIHDEIRVIPAYVKSALQEREVLNSYEGLYNDIENILDKKVKPLGSLQGEEFHEVMSQKIGIGDFKNKSLNLINKFKQVIKDAEEDRDFLVHGDMSPMNFCNNNDVIQFLDWEWASKSNNEVLSVIYDFGNLRARAWNHKEFRDTLDEEIIQIYQNNPEKAKAIISLGILRSHCLLAGFFEDYPQEKQRIEQETLRRENTEGDIRKVFEIADVKI